MAVQLVEVNDKPMTIIYPGAMGLAENAVAEDGTVGIRIPMMDFCQQLVARFGRPLVSTSANISGEATPRKFSEIPESIRSAVDFVVDPVFEKGATGQASSIIKVGLDYSIEIIRKYGRVQEVIFKSQYKYNGKQYILNERYGYGYICI